MQLESAQIELRSAQIGSKNSLTAAKFSCWTKYRGIVFTLLSTLCFSFNLLVVKELEHYHPMSVSVWHHVALLILTILPFIFFQFVPDGNATIFSSVFPLKSRESALLAAGVVVS
jgi:drug/metabolite transporter (DMT)-like permease